MAISSLTLKLPFLGLNQSKQDEFEYYQSLNTSIANQILSLPKQERKKLSSADFAHIDFASMWVNQTIRNAKARTKVKQFKSLPLETNNQAWRLHKVGETYSISFNLHRGRGKRIPLEIHQNKYRNLLDGLLTGSVEKGTLKLWRSKKGIWYALISLSMEVPDSEEPQGWIGVDRGQNNIAAASLSKGMAKFWNGKQIKHLRRKAAKLRKSLQQAKKLKTVKRLESKERRMMSYINHCISKQLVSFAKDFNCGLVFEDLSGIRQTSKQRKKNKSDAGENRDFWSFYQLENYCRYKSVLAGVPMKKRPAPYTSKSCCKCGVIGKRQKHSFRCVNPNCTSHHNADWGASQNIGQWDGFSCSTDFQKTLAVMVEANESNGVHDAPPNRVISSERELESPSINL